jgi:hypothetical protein
MELAAGPPEPAYFRGARQDDPAILRRHLRNLRTECAVHDKPRASHLALGRETVSPSHP